MSEVHVKKEDLNIGFNPEDLKNDIAIQAFLEFRKTGKISTPKLIVLGIKSLILDPPIAILKYWPGPIGFKLRQIMYSFLFKNMGKNVLIGHSTEITYPKSISLSEYCFIDHHVTLEGLFGSIEVGKRVHIAPYSIITGLGNVVIEDYVGIGAFCRIYSHSEAPVDGKRLCGPMIPEEMKGMITAPVRICKDALIGTGSVILPGATIGEGAIVAANSFVPANSYIRPWTIVAGSPAKMVGLRKKVTVPDI